MDQQGRKRSFSPTVTLLILVFCSAAVATVGFQPAVIKEQQIQLQFSPDLNCDVFSPLLPLEAHIERVKRYINTHRATDENYWDLGLLLWKAPVVTKRRSMFGRNG
jgi:hypothetical protein